MELDLFRALAQGMYEAYRDAASWKNDLGKPMPKWVDLSSKIQDYWTAAADRAIAMTHRPGGVLFSSGEPTLRTADEMLNRYKRYNEVNTAVYVWFESMRDHKPMDEPENRLFKAVQAATFRESADDDSDGEE